MSNSKSTFFNFAKNPFRAKKDLTFKWTVRRFQEKLDNLRLVGGDSCVRSGEFEFGKGQSQVRFRAELFSVRLCESKQLRVRLVPTHVNHLDGLEFWWRCTLGEAKNKSEKDGDAFLFPQTSHTVHAGSVERELIHPRGEDIDRVGKGVRVKKDGSVLVKIKVEVMWCTLEVPQPTAPSPLKRSLDLGQDELDSFLSYANKNNNSDLNNTRSHLKTLQAAARKFGLSNLGRSCEERLKMVNFKSVKED